MCDDEHPQEETEIHSDLDRIIFRGILFVSVLLIILWILYEVSR